VTRIVLCTFVAALTLLIGLVTAIVQSHNRATGMRLHELREETTLIEAVNDASAAQVIGLDHGPLPHVAQSEGASR
jgi:hypothetical protein